MACTYATMFVARPGEPGEMRVMQRGKSGLAADDTSGALPEAARRLVEWRGGHPSRTLCEADPLM
jgi:hypothetical protein